MTREEAIEVYNGLLNKRIKEAFEFFVPELCKSEDERIRKWLYDYISNCPNNNFAFYGGVGKDAVLNYLEKQKEQPTNEEMLRTLRAEYEKGVADTIAKYEQKEQKHPDGCWSCNDYKKGYEAGRLNGFTAGYNKAMKEQKPTKVLKFKVGDKVHWKDDNINILTITGLRDNAYVTDSSYGPILFSDENKWELIEQKELKPSIFPPGLGEVHFNPISCEQKEQKQEWSEEDEKMRNRIIDVLNRTFSVYSAIGTSSTMPSCPTYKDEIAWLKSLCPQYHGDITMTEAYKMGLEAGKASSWKPSKEQMKAFIDFIIGNEYDAHALAHLYAELKKLM